jgi:predicted TIM-barrel fold metal-dependent hydrolase
MTPAAGVVIDAHCHIASEDHIPRSFAEGAMANMAALLTAQGIALSRERVAGLYQRKMQDPHCDELVREMEIAGISKSILLAADFTYALKDCALNVEESFLRHRDVLLRHPGKFEVFGGVDPRWEKDGVALFERSIREFGFRGFKVYPPCGFSPSDPELFPFYELCAHFRLPVVVHIGPTTPALSFETSYPFMVDRAARLFPGVNFILAHGSINFTEECAMLCAFRPNVFLDISAFQMSLRREGSGGSVRAVVSRGINHKVLFGTDWPVYRMQGDQETFVGHVTAEDGPLSDVSDAERTMILHGNIERLLANAGHSRADSASR